MRNLLLHILLLCCFAAEAQRKQYVFTRITTREGLASNHVYGIVQDKNGFMWFASVNGLQRYDGRKIISFRAGPADTAFLPSEPVPQIMLDKHNRFWVRVGQQPGLFNTATFAYQRIALQVSASLLEQSWVKLWEDNEGNMFAGVSKYGILVYKEDKKAFVRDTTIIDMPRNATLVGFQQDPVSGNYWVATNTGMALFDRKQRKLYTHHYNPINNPVLAEVFINQPVTTFFVDNRQRLWIGNWTMPQNREIVSCYDIAQRRLTTPVKISSPIPKYRELHRFRQQRNGSVWVHGLGVLAELNENSGQFEYLYNDIFYDYGIRYEVVYDFYEDREQNVWLGTDQGVYVFNPRAQRFTSKSLDEAPKQSGSPDRSLTTILQLRNSDIWAGSWGQGVFIYDTNFHIKPNHIAAGTTDGNYNLVWSMLEQTGTKKVWLGCQLGRLMVYDQQSKRTTFIRHPVFNDLTIRRVMEDKQGNIWFGTQHGRLIKWDLEKGRKNFNDGFQLVHSFNSNIFSLKCDDGGLIWVTSELEGANVFDAAGKLVATYNNKGGAGKSLSANKATDVLFYNDSTVVICALAVNILNRKTGNINIISAANGLPSNTVNTAQRDKDGNLWLGLINGLCRYNMKRNIFTVFSQKDGIVQNDFQNGSSCMLADGRMLFNNQRDFVYFRPDQIVPPSAPPDVSITDFKLFNTYLPPDSVLQLDRVMLNHDQNSITIEFAALSFLQKDKMTYYYKLEGIDEEWMNNERFTYANFALLPPGDYTFKVKCENGDGIPSKNITSLRIHIRPPFWRQEWFILLCIFATAGLIYLAHRLRVQQLVKMEKVRDRIARDLHDDMGSTLSTINILSEMAKMKVARDTEKTSEYISKISDNSHRMMEAMDDIVWSINPTNDSMQRIAARMREFATSVLEAKDIEVSFRVDEKVKDLRLDMESRRDFFLIFKEAVNNTAKYSQASNVSIDITVQSHRLIMQIQDNGKGFDVQQADSGNGLTNMRKRAESLRGNLIIESVPGVGTKVRLEVPRT